MNTEFKSSFTKDLRPIKNKALLNRLKRVIELVEQADSLEAIPQLKKLGVGSSYYRIRLGEYRAGLVIEADKVTFVRFLHRKEVYRYFP